MDRLAHFHFIIIFSSHRWSSASFCYVRSLATPPCLSAPSRGGRSSSLRRSPVSFPPGINTHGGTGRESRWRNTEVVDEPGMELTAGQKIAEREILLPGTRLPTLRPHQQSIIPSSSTFANFAQTLPSGSRPFLPKFLGFWVKHWDRNYSFRSIQL